MVWAAAGAGAQDIWPKVDGHQIGLHVTCEEHHALGRAFRARIEQRLTDMFRALLGGNAVIDVLDVPALETWLGAHDVGEVTGQICREHGLEKHETTILVVVRCRRGTYELSAVESNRHFDYRGQVRKASVVQRQMVPDIAGRLALRCWSPIGTVTNNKGDRYEVTFKNHDRLLSVQGWSRLGPGASLQLYREVFVDDAIQQDAHPSEFLIVESVGPRSITTRLAGNETQWFQYLGSPGARYLVRRVNPEPGPITVEVRLTGGEPREGCDVHVSSTVPKSQDQAGPRVGLTASDGRLTFELPAEGLVYVGVVYDKDFAVKPYLHGVSPDPLRFQFTYRGESSDYVNALVRLSDDIRDRNIRIEDLASRVSEASKGGDTALVEKLVAESRQYFEVQELIDRSHAIEAEARKKRVGGDVLTEISKLAEEVRDRAEKLGKHSAHEAFAMAVTPTRLRELEQQLESAWKALEFEKALPLLREYVKHAPDNENFKRRLAELEQALEPKSQEHAQARATVARAAGISSIESLIDRWDEISPAVDTLLQNGDWTRLYRVQRELSNWSNLIVADAKAIESELLEKKARLRPDRSRFLSARKSALEKISNDLLRFDKQIEQTLQKAR